MDIIKAKINGVIFIEFRLFRNFRGYVILCKGLPKRF